jgi:flagellum-specific ATP synthase
MKHAALWRAFMKDTQRLIDTINPFQHAGRLTRINGLVMEASGLKLPLGSGCQVMAPGGSVVEAEVVGFSGEKLFMMPTDNVFGLFPGALVRPVEAVYPQLVPGLRISPRRRSSDRAKHLPVGEALLGRVVDGAGRPLDSLGPLRTEETRSLHGRPINPLNRSSIRDHST